MKLLNISATGEEDVFEDDEMNDLVYRRNQLKALQEEVIDLEDLKGAISITDLTYTEYKSDLMSILKKREAALKRAPKGMYAITSNSQFQEAPPGVIFCLRQVTSMDTERNPLAPYLLLYVTEEGENYLHYTQGKHILDHFRKLAVGKQEPLEQLVKLFNEETANGTDMHQYTSLLQKASQIIQNKQEESSFDSFFKVGGTQAEQFRIGEELKELELISFLIVRGN